MGEIKKLGVDGLSKLGKSKSNFTKKVSISQRDYEMLKEKLQKWKKQIRTFRKGTWKRLVFK
jgi:5-bromo-4-chloroindolyl phosphate hydrolysis protein